MADYWLGFFTLPVLALILFLLYLNVVLLERDLEDWFGISFEFRTKRGVGKISDYLLRNNIWWERPFGPVYAGGWYRENEWNNSRLFNRWIGVGRTSGPCLTVYRKYDLGKIEEKKIHEHR